MARHSEKGRFGPRLWLGVGTIRGQIFAAFALVTLIIAIVGVYATYGMREAGHMVVRTFDMPLMAISHARLAKSQFEELRYRTLKRRVGALGALKGPLHGGAPGPALDMVFACRAEASRSGRPLSEVTEAWVRHTLEEPGSDEERSRTFADRLRNDMRRQMSDLQVAAYPVAAPFEQLWLGLARYWRKKSA